MRFKRRFVFAASERENSFFPAVSQSMNEFGREDISSSKKVETYGVRSFVHSLQVNMQIADESFEYNG